MENNAPKTRFYPPRPRPMGKCGPWFKRLVLGCVPVSAVLVLTCRTMQDLKLIYTRLLNVYKVESLRYNAYQLCNFLPSCVLSSSLLGGQLYRWYTRHSTHLLFGRIAIMYLHTYIIVVYASLFLGWVHECGQRCGCPESTLVGLYTTLHVAQSGDSLG